MSGWTCSRFASAICYFSHLFALFLAPLDCLLENLDQAVLAEASHTNALDGGGESERGTTSGSRSVVNLHEVELEIVHDGSYLGLLARWILTLCLAPSLQSM